MARMNSYREFLEAPIQKKVLLFSGGLDSWAVMRLWKPDVLVFAAINHRYQEKELQSISQQSLPYPLIVDRRLDLSKEERMDAIIPLRNLYLIGLASKYGDRIAMGVLYGEVNGDKSHEFRHLSEQVLDKCYEPSYWSEGRKITIEFPVSHLTKAELIANFLAQGFDKEELLRTRSCYAVSKFPCGECSACLKRFVAFHLNGLQEKYESDPRNSPFLKEIKQRWTSYAPRRKKELKRVFDL